MMVATPRLVAVKVRLVLPGLITTKPLVVTALLMVSASPFGLRSFVSGLMMTGTLFGAEMASLTAVGSNLSKKLMLVRVKLLVIVTPTWLSFGPRESPVL